ncbi:ASC1-like protein [Glycine soja]
MEAGKESKLHKRKSLLEMMNKALTMEEKNISTARCNNILGSNLERRANNCAHSFTGTRTYEVLLTLDKEKHQVDGPIYYYVFNSLLYCLLVMHIYWWVLIFRMLVKQIQARGKVSEDVRSDSEDEDEHED